MGLTAEEFTFRSFNKRDHVYAWIYRPHGQPRAVIQLLHGYAEHHGRYRRMIETLVADGYVVAADDHVGHGVTARESGHWQDTGGTGYETYVRDERTLTEHVRQRFPDAPLFLFGHSWGSMIAREYVSRYADDLSGVILSGVVEQLTSVGLDLEVVRYGARAALSPSGREEGAMNELMGVLAGRTNYRFGEDAPPTAWIARSEAVRADFDADPLGSTRVRPTSEFARDLLLLYVRVGTAWFAKRLPTDMPVLIMSGDQDPMGNYGEGAYHLANQLWSAGNRDVRTRVYPGVRHEIHNEPETRDLVVAEIVSFVERRLPPSP